MMKKFLCVAVLLALCLALAACAAEAAPENETTPTENEPNDATGYPSGALQEVSVFYDGALYSLSHEEADCYADGEAAIALLGLTPIGEIVAEDNLTAPDAELEASHLEVGTPLYSDGEGRLYVLFDTGTLRTLVSDRVATKLPDAVEIGGKETVEPTYGLEPVEPPEVER